VPEAGHLTLAQAYRPCLERYAAGTAVGRRDWLLHCAEAYTIAAELSPLH
jgi:hypothetical protein